ncbi:MAG: purine-binding chemotaxis protein CheW [Nitrospirae bacterium]|nr:purine-binding chemotaxis protein CheW [Nitrospirota bacterium]MBI3595379.1 purine-binding chemotaxis protein CheW [Nitrospirota bacterium]
MEPLDEASPEIQILTFFLSEEEYGVNIKAVKEIIEYATMTKIPASPPFIRGVINLRGSVVPVIDFAKKFGFPESQVTKRTCIVIAEVEHDGRKNLVGVIVDRVNQVMDLLPSEIEPPPTFGTPVQNDYIGGLIKRDKNFILILDFDKVLSLDELKSGFTLVSPVP